MGFLRLKPGRHLQRGVWRDEALRLAKLRFLARIIDRIGSVLVTLGAEVTRRCGRDSSLRDRRQRHWWSVRRIGRLKPDVRMERRRQWNARLIWNDCPC